MSRLTAGGAVVISALLLAPGGAGQDTPAAGAADATVASTVADVLRTARHPWLRWPDLTDVAPALRELYAAEPDRLIWFAGGRAEPALPGAIESLAMSIGHGLNPADYDAERLAASAANVGRAEGASERALFDVALTVSVVRAIAAVHHGRVDPRTLGWGYDPRAETMNRLAILRDVRARGVPAVMDALEPSYPHYGRNLRELARYRVLASRGDGARVPALAKPRRKVAPGQSWDGIPALRSRLRVLGDLADGTSSVADSPVHDPATVAALKRFQARHILDADGVVGPATIEALNVPLARRVRQLELALERGRWLPRITDRPTVFVNVPIFRLWASDPAGGEEPLRMNVVVGKAMNRTPIFVDQMEYVVFRPYWNAPYGITKDEIVPHARRDPAYLARENFEIVASGADAAPALPATPENLDAVVAGRLYIRQKPGPRNALGLAKFIFPNADSVYMHGTPAQQAFARTRRDFSHGCIRLENPAGLAEWVLRDVPGWTRARIDEAMQAERPKRVNLSQPLTVVLFYDTVHVNSEGTVHFVSDIYGHDRVLDQALLRGYPYPRGR